MLKYQLDTLDGVDSSLHSLYTQTEAGYTLNIEGLDDGKELKTALQKERENSKAAESKAKELQKLIDEAQSKTLAEQGKFKELFEKTNSEKLETQKQLSELTRKVAERQGAIMVKEISAQLTSDPIEQKIIERFATDYLEIEGDAAKWARPEAEIIEALKPFVRSKASGTGDKGNPRGEGGKDGAAVMVRAEFNALTPDAQMKFIRGGGTLKD